MFHTLAYHANNGAAQMVNFDMTPAVDPVITQQGGHYIFTDDFRLGLAYAIGATTTGIRLNMPSINAYGRHQIWPVDSTGVQPAVVPDLPAVVDYTNQPIVVPQEEQMAWEYSNTAVVAEDGVILLWLFTPDHSMQIPTGLQRLTVLATPAAIAAVAYAWTGPSALTFQQSLRGGWYTVMGVDCVGVNVLAVRILFPRAKQYSGRLLRPGFLSQNAYGRRPFNRFMGRLGPFGKFHSFEPPQIEIYAAAAGAVTPDMRFDLVFHGDAEPTAY